MAFYFSSVTKALYDTDVFPVASLPANKVEISEAAYTELMTKQNQGYVILADGSGNPYTVNQSEASATDIKHAASVATTLALGHVKIGNTMTAANDGTLDLNDGAVGTSKLANGAVTADKVKDNETLPVNVSGRAYLAQNYDTSTGTIKTALDGKANKVDGRVPINEMPLFFYNFAYAHTFASGSYDSTKPYKLLASFTTTSTGSPGNNGCGCEFLVYFTFSAWARIKVHASWNSSSLSSAELQLIETYNISDDLIKTLLLGRYSFTANSDTGVKFELYWKFTGLWQNVRLYQIPSQTGDVGLLQNTPWTMYQNSTAISTLPLTELPYNNLGIGIYTGSSAQYLSKVTGGNMYARGKVFSIGWGGSRNDLSVMARVTFVYGSSYPTSAESYDIFVRFSGTTSSITRSDLRVQGFFSNSNTSEFGIRLNNGRLEVWCSHVQVENASKLSGMRAIVEFVNHSNDINIETEYVESQTWPTMIKEVTKMRKLAFVNDEQVGDPATPVYVDPAGQVKQCDRPTIIDKIVNEDGTDIEISKFITFNDSSTFYTLGKLNITPSDKERIVDFTFMLDSYTSLDNQNLRTNNKLIFCVFVGNTEVKRFRLTPSVDQNLFQSFRCSFTANINNTIYIKVKRATNNEPRSATFYYPIVQGLIM